MPKAFRAHFKLEIGPEIEVRGGGSHTCREIFCGNISSMINNKMIEKFLIEYPRPQGGNEYTVGSLAVMFALKDQTHAKITLEIEGNLKIVEDFAQELVKNAYPTVTVTSKSTFDQFLQTGTQKIFIEGDAQVIHAFCWIQLCDRLQSLGAWKGSMAESLRLGHSTTYRGLWYNSSDRDAHVQAWERLNAGTEPPAWWGISYYGYGPNSLYYSKDHIEKEIEAATRLLSLGKNHAGKPYPQYILDALKGIVAPKPKRKYVRKVQPQVV